MQTDAADAIALCHFSLRPRGSIEKREGPLQPGGQCIGGVGKIGGDLDDGCGRRGKGFEGFCRSGPIDGSIAGPQVLVLNGVVVVSVNGDDAGAEGCDGFRGADSHMRVTEIEADTDVVKVAHFENDGEMLRSGDLAEQIFDQQADAERAGKSAQVLDAVAANSMARGDQVSSRSPR